MRAEIQTIVADIEKSLTLLAQRMDRETAAHRLEEFNARVEDPNLWDDPDAAQKLMKDRQALVDAMASYDTIKQDLSDQQEMIEMGEMEDDDEIVTEAENALKALKVSAAAKELEALLNGEADANDTFLESIQALAARRLVIGRRCWRGCISAGPNARATRLNYRPRVQAKRLASSRPATRFRATMRMAG
jgi:hypothetical protein